MKVSGPVFDAATGETTIQEIEVPGVLTAGQAAERDQQRAREAANAEIRAQLDANDVRAVRWVSEAIRTGDTARIEAHELAQAALRAMLQ